MILAEIDVTASCGHVVQVSIRDCMDVHNHTNKRRRETQPCDECVREMQIEKSETLSIAKAMRRLIDVEAKESKEAGERTSPNIPWPIEITKSHEDTWHASLFSGHAAAGTTPLAALCEAIARYLESVAAKIMGRN